jgi:hypothetical protein
MKLQSNNNEKKTILIMNIDLLLEFKQNLAIMKKKIIL